MPENPAKCKHMPTASRNIRITPYQNKPLVITIILDAAGKRLPANALIDSGTSDVFIDAGFAAKHMLPVIEVDQPSRLELFDGQQSIAGLICYKVPQASLKLGRVVTHHDLFLTKIQQYQVVLGMPWLTVANPEIDFAKKTIAMKTKVGPQAITL